MNVGATAQSSKLFFDILWRNTEEGFFADPLYGGNRDKAGWKLVEFPGVASGAYNAHLNNSEPYRAEPGHPRHPAAAGESGCAGFSEARDNR